jgi:AAA15 family ATPase/GTPase
MLLRFEAGNVFSIAEIQELSLVASKLKGNEKGLLPIPGTSGLRALPVALIYGANASGKTNFVRAFTFMRSAILSSHSQGNPQGGVPRIPFALDDESETKPSHFEAEFVASGSRYIFGFTCDSQSFLTEWLYTFPEGKRRKLYEREGKNVDFGPSMLGAKKPLVDFMRHNSLFISTATQNDHEELSKITNFFREVQYSGALSVSPMTITNTFKEGQIDPRTISFLQTTGTGVVGLEQFEKEIPEQIKMMNSEFIAIARKHLGDDVITDVEPAGKDVEIQLLHQGSIRQHALPLRHESAGTRRLLLLMSKILRALDNGSLLIIDELDASLHTLVAEQIVELFTDPEYNRRGAQLIATTHDTNILACDHLRRDQIWLCEKDNIGVSHIFSLADFKLRATDQFEKGYLEGRFGAIPFAGDLSAMLEVETP